MRKMDVNRVKRELQKARTITMLLLIFFAWLGWGMYSFSISPMEREVIISVQSVTYDSNMFGWARTTIEGIGYVRNGTALVLSERMTLTLEDHIRSVEVGKLYHLHLTKLQGALWWKIVTIQELT